MNPRFYAPDARAVGDDVPLPDDEANHLMHVLRLAAGATVIVFDGRGREFDAVVARTGKQGVTVRLQGSRMPVPEPRVAVTLAQAVLKSNRMDDVVRDAVMMGVAAIQPIVTARSETSLPALTRGHRRERWERIAVSSAKQCGRAVVPPILEPCDFGVLTQALARRALPGPGLMLVEPSTSASAVGIGDLDGQIPREATVLVGPEGGWAVEEIEQAVACCRMVTLGQRTLRADAMPVIALSALFAIWRQL